MTYPDVMEMDEVLTDTGIDFCPEYPTGNHCTHWQFGSGPCCSCGAVRPSKRH